MRWSIFLSAADGLRRLVWLLEEIEVIILAIFNGAEESELFRIFCNLADVFILQEGFSHLGELATFSVSSCFNIVIRVREVELSSTLLTEHAVADIFKELLYGFFIADTLLVAVRKSVKFGIAFVLIMYIRMKGSQLPFINFYVPIIHHLSDFFIFFIPTFVITSTT